MKLTKDYKKAIIYGILGSFFFAFNFVLIRSMNLGGGFFLWSAVLRYLFILPIIAVVLIPGRGFVPVLKSIKRQPGRWLLWSTVGFGVFYAFFSVASIYGESWFIAAIWEFTIVAGVLLTPIFGKKIPAKNLLCSMIIVLGIFVMQMSKILDGVKANWTMLLITMAIAAFGYPLGNRKMMQVTDGEGLTTMQRVFGMSLCSMPFWFICAGISYANAGWPSVSQVFQSFLVALLAGVIGTVFFFAATDLVKNDMKKLAVIEATQSGEVIFTVVLSVIFLKDNMPDVLAWIGIIIIAVGIIVNSLIASR